MKKEKNRFIIIMYICIILEVFLFLVSKIFSKNMVSKAWTCLYFPENIFYAYYYAIKSSILSFICLILSILNVKQTKYQKALHIIIIIIEAIMLVIGLFMVFYYLKLKLSCQNPSGLYMWFYIFLRLIVEFFFFFVIINLYIYGFY